MGMWLVKIEDTFFQNLTRKRLLIVEVVALETKEIIDYQKNRVQSGPKSGP